MFILVPAQGEDHITCGPEATAGTSVPSFSTEFCARRLRVWWHGSYVPRERPQAGATANSINRLRDAFVFEGPYSTPKSFCFPRAC